MSNNQQSSIESTLITTEEAAGMLCVKPSTLEVWRCRGEGPAWVRIGARAIRYERKAILGFIEQGRQQAA